MIHQKIKIKVYRLGSNHSETVEAPHGQNLRKVLLSAGLTPYLRTNKVFNCRGMGICGTCKVLVFEKNEWWDKRSCQIQCFQNLEIQLK